VRVPVIGIGGIATAEDAMEFMLAGASAVQVGTANFINPGACDDVIDGIAAYVSERQMGSVRELIGALRVE
jgi:dihydroorotate dehydrogenase (NAD+) catalytic subunit